MEVVRCSRVTIISLERGAGVEEGALVVATMEVNVGPRELVVGTTSVLLEEVIVVLMVATVIAAEIERWRLVTCMYS